MAKLTNSMLYVLLESIDIMLLKLSYLVGIIVEWIGMYTQGTYTAISKHSRLYYRPANAVHRG